MPSTTAVPALTRRHLLLADLALRTATGWHLLSLDAPTVAALWCWALARALSVHLPATAPLLLASGTWLLYVADRLLDNRRPTAALRDRHDFCRKHRAAFLGACIPATLLLLWLIGFHMHAAARRDDSILFACALAYFALVHLSNSKRLPKELAVGVIFALATAVPAWVRMPRTLMAETVLPLATACFALLCWLNCAGIEKWESGKWESHARAEENQPHASTRWLQLHFTTCALGLASFSLVAGTGFAALSRPAAAALFLALASAAGLLAALDRHHTDLPPLHVRIAADAALLTPLLVLPIFR